MAPPKRSAGPVEGQRQGGVPLRQALERLLGKYGKAEFAAAVEMMLLGKPKWVPDCDKLYEYTFHYASIVDDCPVGEDEEQKLETAAENACKAQVERYCRRTENCKAVTYVSSQPVGGGCNCGVVMGMKRCVYECNWKVEYKCVSGGGKQFL